MRRLYFAAFVVLIVSLPILGLTPVSAQAQGKALIISSLEKYVPMGYATQVESYLISAGYQVTFVKDTDVTINFLTTQLNKYDLIIWRTNVYSWDHTTYWYVGETSKTATLQAYAADFAAGLIDNTNGILGVSEGFFRRHFTSGSLSNVKLAILISSSSFSIAMVLLNAGVKSIIDYYGSFSLTFDMIDYVTRLVVKYLASGVTVKDSVWNTISRFLNQRMEDPLDSSYLPPIWWMGDSTLKIK